MAPVSPPPPAAYLGIRFHFLSPGLRPLAGGSWVSRSGWGRVPCQPGGRIWWAWSLPAPVPQDPLALPAGLKDLCGQVAGMILSCLVEGWGLRPLRVVRPGPSQRGFGFWAHATVAFLFRLYFPLFSIRFSGPVFACFKAVSTAREDELLLEKKNVYGKITEAQPGSPPTHTLSKLSLPQGSSCQQPALLLILRSLCSL